MNEDNHTRGKLKIYADEIPFNYQERFFSSPCSAAFKLLDLLKEKKITPIDLRLYIFLSATCEMATQKCPYTVPEIAKELEIDESNLRRSVSRLQQAGIILVGTDFIHGYNLYLSPNFVSEAPKLKKFIADEFEIPY